VLFVLKNLNIFLIIFLILFLVYVLTSALILNLLQAVTFKPQGHLTILEQKLKIFCRKNKCRNWEIYTYRGLRGAIYSIGHKIFIEEKYLQTRPAEDLYQQIIKAPRNYAVGFFIGWFILFYMLFLEFKNSVPLKINFKQAVGNLFFTVLIFILFIFFPRKKTSLLNKAWDEREILLSPLGSIPC